MIAITNSPSENHTHRGVVSCDRCFIASSQPGRTIQAQALDSRNCARLLACRGICPHRLALIVLRAREPSGTDRCCRGQWCRWVLCSWLAPLLLLLRVGADANTSSAPDSNVTLITLDDFAVCAREDKKEK